MNLFKNITAKYILVTECLPAAPKVISFNLDKKPGAGYTGAPGAPECSSTGRPSI